MRYKELDSVRGLAALSVVISHFLSIFPALITNTYSLEPIVLNFLKYTPFHIFWAGSEAVVTFFVLSGFVLSLQFFNNEVRYIPFIIRRVCRLYIPYICAVFFSFFTFSLFAKNGISVFSTWFNHQWCVPLTKDIIFNHLLLIGDFDPYKFDSVIWSLVHEMRISLIFPVLIYFVIKFDWKISLPIGIVTSFLCFKLLSSVAFLRLFQPVSLTAYYISMFILGAVLAKHRLQLVEWFKNQTRFIKYSVFLLGILLYTFSWTFYGFHYPYKLQINNFIISIGSGIFIIAALANNSFLLTRPALFLGKISYSLYLLHLPILFSALYLLYGIISIPFILIISFAISLYLSYLSYIYIESPSIALGKYLTKKALKFQMEF